ncbi:unnamed protein product [Durusdinium trenchii]|uniref:Uncharacterized protein n=2 Tax=Durusdinium trenchii TaxID=1381693 RepID=A0ABP0NH59_9DINO
MSHASLAKRGSRRKVSNDSLAWLQNLIQCEDGEEISATQLSNKLIAFYFSASWCPPCQYFVPILAQGYKQIRDMHGSEAFEVILVPLDVDETLWQLHMAKMPWLSIPLKNREIIVKLFTAHCITEAPRLIIMDSSGTLVSDNARGGDGFGFGCDPLHAYDKLVEELVKMQRNREDSSKIEEEPSEIED